MGADKPWFVAKDVCEALGKVWKGAEALEVIPEHWKGVRKLGTPSGDQELWIINEAAVAAAVTPALVEKPGR
jgi:prophage antirepressor-like protein